jgi:type VI secretion system protein ImpH
MVSLDRPEQDRFGSYVAALCGLGMPAFRNRDAVDDLFKLAHAGIFGRQVKCAEGLQIILSNYFGVALSIDQWVGYWLPIPEQERTRLGNRQGFCTLGEDAVIGERIWDCQTKFRILIGPLALEDYLRFLPNGRSYEKLADMVKLYIGLELDWEVQLILQKEQVPSPTLGSSLALGWTTWIGSRTGAGDADDLVVAQIH